jgi:hypothetical protein
VALFSRGHDKLISMQATSFYLSSTFLDLSRERELLAEYLGKFGQIDVQSLLASPDRPLQMCLDDIDRCDAYILLVGSRYGEVVEGMDGEMRSITHHEFWWAAQQKKPIFAFFLCYPTVGLNDPALQDSEVKERLIEFKKQVKSLGGTPGLVHKRDNLIGEVLAAINRHLELSLSRDPQTFYLSPKKATNSIAQGTLAGKDLFLMIQVKERGVMFDLIPEAMAANAEGLFEPVNVEFDPASGVEIGSLPQYLEEWSQQAQDSLLPDQADQIEDVVIEIFLSAEMLAHSLSGNDSIGAFRRGVASIADQPYVVRTLTRALGPRIFHNKLRNRWHNSSRHSQGLRACLRWPLPNGSTDQHQARLQFKARLKDMDADSCLLCLADLPADSIEAGSLITAILEAPLPLLLLWHACSAGLKDRFRNSLKLLDLEGLAPPKLGDSVSDAVSGQENPPITRYPIDAREWSSLSLATRRRSLFGRGESWVDDAMLLVDCPDRWPRKIPDVQSRPMDRLQLRIGPSA